MKAAGITLKPRNPPRPLVADDIPLIVVSHNERRLIEPFLSHYRRLGVTRFLWVDDASADGSPDMLASQHDVDLYTSNVRFKAAVRGRVWREMLAERYGKDRWYVSVDTDEFLIYLNCETVGLRQVIDSLERRGVFHMPAPMIDMYPPGKVSEAVYTGADGKMPWEVASLLDGDGYSMRASSHGLAVHGGVRARAFGIKPQLSKFPVLYWQANTHLRKAIHSPAPFWRNFHYPLGVLLHFKFFSDFASQFASNAANGQHFNKGELYKQMLDEVEEPDELFLEDGSSISYRNSQDLFRRHFFADWRD